MKNPFLNLPDYAVCIILARQLKDNEKSVRDMTNHERENTQLWVDILQYTYLGLLITEIYNRNISEDYFRKSISLTRY